VKIRRKHLFLVPLAFVVLAGALVIFGARLRQVGGARLDDAPRPFLLEDIVSAPRTMKAPFFVVDVDLDGNDDLLINEPDRLCWYRLHKNRMTLAGEAVYERPGSTRMVADANGDGRPEFFVFTETAEGSMLSCHDWFSSRGPSEAVYTIGPLRPFNEVILRPWAKINFFGSFSTEKGAPPMILIGLNTGKGEGPRSLLALEGTTGREIWRFDLGPQTMELVCDDLGMQTPYAFLSTIAVANGTSCNGTTDSTSYVLCLDQRDGRLLWKKEVGGFGARSRLALADLNGDGRNEIIVARSLASRDPAFAAGSYPWTVAVLSGEGEILSSVALPSRLASILTLNLDRDPMPEVIVEGADGKIIFLDNDLTIDRIIQFVSETSFHNFKIFEVSNEENRRKPEFACQIDSMVIVGNHKGEVIAERKFTPYTEAQFARYDGRNHVVAASGDSYHIMALERTPLATRLRAHASRLTIAELAAAVFLVGVGGFHFRRYLKKRREKHITLDEAQNDLLTAMAAYGHGGSSLKIVDRIRLHLKNWDRVQSGAAAREELFAKLHATFLETIVPELKHIAMLAHKAGVPEEAWGTIISRARLAGQEMEAILAGGPEGGVDGMQEHISEALMTLGDVDESLARIRSHLRSVFRTPVAEALERVVARFREESGDTKVSLALPSGSSSAEGVFLSPVAFDKILEGLLANSARATEGRTDAEIVIEARWEGNYCTIDVRDNGCGIPREDWKRVFDRSFTTKEEGGFGLYYAHETLARFNGKIFVIDSVVGSGTTMRAVLRKS
jgi:signal transduction histidine kinase